MAYRNAATAARKPPSRPPLTAGPTNAAPAVEEADAALPLAELLPEADEEVLVLLAVLLSLPSELDDPVVVPLVAPVAEAPADEEVKEVTEALPLADVEPVALALPVSEAVAEKLTQAADPADWAWARSPALQLLSRQPAAWAPISDCDAQAQAWSVAGVQTAEMAEVRQGVCGHVLTRNSVCCGLVAGAY